MISEQDYRELAEVSYWVDSNKKDNSKLFTPKEGKDIKAENLEGLSQDFQILKAEDNTDNGMQAMAVAPVDKNGDVDYSQVVIAYAGTNSSDGKDLETDFQSIIGGSDELKYRTGLNSAMVTDTQFTTAIDFAKAVEKEVKEKNPDAVITTTGHSLGGSLSMYVALKHGYQSTTYNGPDIHNLISDEEISYM